MTIRPFRLYLASVATSFLVHTITTNNSNPPLCTAQLLPDDPTYEDFYCGFDWEEANARCEYPCPSGLDSDCPPLSNGRKRRCIAAAGCFSRYTKVYWSGVISLSFDREQHLANDAATEIPQSAGDDEAPVEAGPPSIGLMSKEVKDAFESSFRDYLLEVFKEEKMDISTVTVQDQEYDKPCVAAAIGGTDPTSTSLDTLVRFVGAYIPIETYYTDDQFGEEILDSINDNPQLLVNAIKSSSPYFDAITGASALEQENVGESPSASPSEPPSRGFDQNFDVRIDPRPTGSFGLVFRVRTVREGNTILLTGMSFVTNYEGKLEYEIYSRLGPFERYVGRNSYWTLVASGETIGRGPKEYTRVLEEDYVVNDGDQTLHYIGFKPLHIPGDRGQRSFYITTTQRFKNDEGNGIPILFSYPISSTEGEREYDIVDSTEELEIYEGDGVLDYPWPVQRDGPYYRRPRGFIGAFDYDRYPCHPIINFTGWPCPYVPKKKNPTQNPTRRPTPAPTNHPTKSPFVTATIATTMNPVVQTVQVETDVPELEVPIPVTETNNADNATVTPDVDKEQEVDNTEGEPSSAQEGEIINSVAGLWGVAGKRYFYGLATLAVLSFAIIT